MSISRTCSECGRALPAEFPHGPCPACALQGALALSGAEAETPPTEQAGQIIGAYKLTEKIGEGGYGVVYRAEQAAPIRRVVAVKVIKLGMDTEQVIARFEAERQALAMMDHPSIAKVFEAGATATGRPYFVMELVEGARITDYCNEHEISAQARLDLFVKVCGAVQHAHQKGIIHRDLKPSNILVTLQDGKPVPKVIDFGIAKATQEPLTDKTIWTSYQQFLGTPAYMSPEQAGMSGMDVDTRSDIYALGVLLYELLTGRTPFEKKELLQAGVEEMRRVIRETEPSKPSTKLSQELASMSTRKPNSDSPLRTQGSEPESALFRRLSQIRELIPRVRGDLDWIVMKCLEKDRARRYETASGLARDVERHLHHEPVTAAAPGTLYRMRKFVRRNGLACASAAAIALTVLIGLGLSTLLYLRESKARHAENQARVRAMTAEQASRTEAAKSRQVAKFLQRMLKGVGPSAAKGRDTQMLREILDQTAESIGKDLKDQWEVEAELQDTLGTVYFDLGKYKESEAMHRASLEQARRAYGSNDVHVAASLNHLALALQKEGRLSEAEVVSRDALAMRSKLLGNESIEVSESLSTLGSLLWRENRFAEAETNYLESIALARKVMGNENPTVALGLGNLGNLTARQGKPAEAEGFFRQALALQRKLFGDESMQVAHTLDSLGNSLADQGKEKEAEPFLREGLALRRKLLEADHPDLAFSLNNLAAVLHTQGKEPEAETLDREAVAIRRKRLGNEHQYVALSLNNLGGILLSESKLEEAEAACRESVAIRRKAQADQPLDVAQSLNTLDNVLWARGHLQECEAARREVVAILKSVAPGSPELDASLENLVSVLDKEGKRAEEENVLRDSLSLRRKLLGKDSPPQPQTIQKLIDALETMTATLLAQEKFAEAESTAREWLQLGEKEMPDSWQTFDARATLGACLSAQKHFNDAEPLLLSGYEGMKQREKAIPAEYKSQLPEAAQHLVRLYEATNRPDRAAAWKNQLKPAK